MIFILVEAVSPASTIVSSNSSTNPIKEGTRLGGGSVVRASGLFVNLVAVKQLGA